MEVRWGPPGPGAPLRDSRWRAAYTRMISPYEMEHPIGWIARLQWKVFHRRHPAVNVLCLSFVGLLLGSVDQSLWVNRYNLSGIRSGQKGYSRSMLGAKVVFSIRWSLSMSVPVRYRWETFLCCGYSHPGRFWILIIEGIWLLRQGHGQL
jgi:hypothetical protein